MRWKVKNRAYNFQIYLLLLLLLLLLLPLLLLHLLLLLLLLLLYIIENVSNSSSFFFIFEVSLNEYGESHSYNLKEDGSDIPVTNENRDQFVKLYIDWVLNSAIYERFRAFYLGFHTVMASNALIVSVGCNYCDYDVAYALLVRCMMHIDCRFVDSIRYVASLNI